MERNRIFHVRESMKTALEWKADNSMLFKERILWVPPWGVLQCATVFNQTLKPVGSREKLCLKKILSRSEKNAAIAASTLLPPLFAGLWYVSVSAQRMGPSQDGSARFETVWNSACKNIIYYFCRCNLIKDCENDYPQQPEEIFGTCLKPGIFC